VQKFQGTAGGAGVEDQELVRLDQRRQLTCDPLVGQGLSADHHGIRPLQGFVEVGCHPFEVRFAVYRPGGLHRSMPPQFLEVFKEFREFKEMDPFTLQGEVDGRCFTAVAGPENGDSFDHCQPPPGVKGET